MNDSEHLQSLRYWSVSIESSSNTKINRNASNTFSLTHTLFSAKTKRNGHVCVVHHSSF